MIAVRIALMAVLGSITATSVLAHDDDIDHYLTREMKRLHLPGLSLAIVRDGRVIKARGYGLANLELKAPATTSTVYEIGSNTKQFTAAAVLLLVERGKLALDDSVRKFFPEAPASWQRITVRHLLSHTSGIQNHVAVPGYLDVFRTNLSFETTPGRDEILRMFFALPLEFEPGETWSYDNTGYYLLGLIVEKVSGQTYWQFLEESIFRPLGMQATRSTDPRPLVPNRASGYEWVNGGYENRPVLGPSVAFSAGALLSTVEDLARWDSALHSNRILSQASRELMWTPVAASDGTPAALDYGFGWFVERYRRQRLVQHSGGTPGFSSAIYRYRDEKLTIILLTNHGDRAIDHLAIEIAGRCVPALRRPVGATDPDPAATARVREALTSLLNGSPVLELFTRPMRVYLRTATAKAIWRWYSEQGKLVSMAYSDSEDSGGHRILRYKVELDSGSRWVSAKLAGDGSIAQIYWW